MSENPTKSTPSTPVLIKRVLLVEDDLTTIKLIQEILATAGFEIITASDGKDAWLKMTPEKMPHLIITDILMPGMDGFAFFKQLKQNQETRSIPVLVISTRKQMEETFLSGGAEAFLIKPFSAEELLSLTKKLANRSGPLTV